MSILRSSAGPGYCPNKNTAGALIHRLRKKKEGGDPGSKQAYSYSMRVLKTYCQNWNGSPGGYGLGSPRSLFFVSTQNKSSK